MSLFIPMEKRMHWALVQEIATECEAFSLADSDTYPVPSFSKEQLCWCIAEMAANARPVNEMAVNAVKVASGLPRATPQTPAGATK